MEQGYKELGTSLKRRAPAAQVMYAENLQVRPGGKGTPPLLPSRSLSARSDSTSSILQPRAGTWAGPGRDASWDLHATSEVRQALLSRSTASRMQ